MSLSQRLAAAWAALSGESDAASAAKRRKRPAAAGDADASPASRIAQLELDVEERDERIESLLREAEAQRGAVQGEAATAAADRMGRLLKHLAPLVAQADAMKHFQDSGRAITAEDALAIVARIEAAIAEEGVERIGAAGEETAFDSRRHQRLSGGDVRDGDPVEVRFIGFRQGERILAKALVSRKG